MSSQPCKTKTPFNTAVKHAESRFIKFTYACHFVWKECRDLLFFTFEYRNLMHSASNAGLASCFYPFMCLDWSLADDYYQTAGDMYFLSVVDVRCPLLLIGTSQRHEPVFLEAVVARGVHMCHLVHTKCWSSNSSYTYCHPSLYTRMMHKLQTSLQKISQISNAHCTQTRNDLLVGWHCRIRPPHSWFLQRVGANDLRSITVTQPQICNVWWTYLLILSTGYHVGSLVLARISSCSGVSIGPNLQSAWHCQWQVASFGLSKVWGKVTQIETLLCQVRNSRERQTKTLDSQ